MKTVIATLKKEIENLNSELDNLERKAGEARAAYLDGKQEEGAFAFDKNSEKMADLESRRDNLRQGLLSILFAEGYDYMEIYIFAPERSC